MSGVRKFVGPTRSEWYRIIQLVREQEKDHGLWSESPSGHSAALQDALGKLHTLIEEIHQEFDPAEKTDEGYR